MGHKKVKLAGQVLKTSAGLSVGLAKTSVALVQNTRGVFYREKDFRQLLEKIQAQAVAYEKVATAVHQALDSVESRQTARLDALGLATQGLLTHLFGWRVPDDVKQAYELAYPDKASQMDFQAAVESLDNEGQVTGFINGVKGKLFELKYTDYLNDGHLPAGYHAELAQSPTQAGWDLAILDEQGQVDDVLQLKATSSLDYIEHALDRYPYIQLVSTDEVYSQVTLADMADQVINSGISNEELTDYVQDTVLANMAASQESFSFLPSVIPYAIIAYSVAKNKQLSEYKKGKEFSRRALLSYVCHTLGLAVGAVTNMWWLIPVTSIGLRLAQRQGERKYKAYKALQKYAQTNEQVLKKYHKILANLRAEPAK